MGSPHTNARRNIKASKPARSIQRMPIAKLRPHPMQAELFSDLSEAELKELAADLRENGLVNPVEVLPDGTIIAGHQRVRAAKSLDWTKISCWVRTDLEEAGPAAIEERLVADNLHRRHLDELQIARCYRHLKQLQQDEPFGDRVRGDVRDRLAKRFGYSGRQLDRLTRLLDLPIELQRAYSARTLSQVTASKLVGLPRNNLQRIAERVAHGERAEEVSAEYLTKPSTPSKKIGTAVSRFVGALRKSNVDLENRLADFRGRLSNEERRVLKRGRQIARQLLDLSDENEERHGREGQVLRPAKKQLAKSRPANRNKSASCKPTK